MLKNKKKYGVLILYLISFLILYNFPFREIFKLDFLPSDIKKASALGVTIDGNIGTAYTRDQTRGPNVVFTSATNGYVFYVDSDGTCAYATTTDTGLTWGLANSLYSGTDCVGTTVWYDRWTPGDTTGNYIHIVFGDDSEDDLYYERLNTTDNTQLGETSATTTSAITLNNTNTYSITKGTDGDLYIGISDNGASYVVKCSGSCNSTANWSGSNPLDADIDAIALRPLASGNIMMVNWDFSANIFRSKVYTDSTNTWDASWTNIAAANDNTNFGRAFDITLNPSNNNLYLCLNNYPDNATNDIITGIYTGSWATSTANVITDFAYEGCTIAYDQRRSEIYATYWYEDSATYSGGANIKKSSNFMTSWSAEVGLALDFGLVDSPAYYGFSSNITSNDMIYVAGYMGEADDLRGEALTETLIQSAYRFQNENNSPNSNSNMADANTAITDVKIGQRITARLQLENPSAQATSTVYSLQFTTDSPTSPSASWANISSNTAIATAYGIGAANGAAITSQVCGAPSNTNNSGWTFQNGTWHENTATTNSFSSTRSNYTEFGFMIHTNNAAVNTTYYLRLYNNTAGRALNYYYYYPALTTVATLNSGVYSKDRVANPPSTATSSLLYFFDDLDYTRSVSSDNQYATVTASSNIPEFLFVQKNTNSTDQITATWEGQTSLACAAAKYVVLEVYNFNRPGWESQATSTTCSASTDFSLSKNITSNLSYYYENGYDKTYWRVWQASAQSPTFLTDQIAFTFTAAGSLGISAPASVTFTNYALGGVGYSQYTWATGTEQIIVTNSIDPSNGWTLSSTCTDFTHSLYTITANNVYFQGDGVTSTEPTLVFAGSGGYTGITEPNGDYVYTTGGGGAPVTILSASNGNGKGTYYIQPTFKIIIVPSGTYATTYTSTLTLTLV